MKDDFVSLSDFIWLRTRNRLSGLTDEEYFWEPVPGCWTIRDRGDGCYHADGVRPAPEPAPFTTIAWRLAHLTGCYGADRNGTFLRVELEPPVLDRAGVRPATAEAALDLLERAHSRWRRHLSAVPAGAMSDRLGPIAGPYADGTLASFVLHMLDEHIHHGAELGLLRDLYRATAAGVAVSTGDDLVDAAIRDPAVLAVLAGDPPERGRAIRAGLTARSPAGRSGPRFGRSDGAAEPQAGAVSSLTRVAAAA